MRRLLFSAAASAALAIALAAPVAAHEPTCVDFGALGIVVHGQHVVRDYVIGDAVSGWPIQGGAGQYLAGQGAAVPGGPGPGFHFLNGFAPGASFCNEQSQAPGAHF
jgi:hypothetical protein